MTNDEMRGNVQPQRRSRSRRYERTEQLFEARTMPVEDTWQEEPAQYARPALTKPAPLVDAAPETISYDEYTPNDPPAESVYARPAQAAPVQGRSRRRARYEQAVMEEAPENLEDVQLTFVTQSQPADESSWAAYRRPQEESAGQEPAEDQFAYAPPVRLPIAGWDAYDDEPQEPDYPQEQSSEYGTAGIYRTREMGYAYEDAPQDDLYAGYQVQDDAAELDAPKQKKGHPVLVALASLLAAAAVAFLLFPDQITGFIGGLFAKETQQESVPTIVSTPAPQRSYDAATPVEISSVTGSAISRISGTVEMEPHIVKETSILTRNQRPDGDFDYYLFNATDGRLLSYFEKLALDDVRPLADGGYFVRQSPYLIGEDGSEMIPTAALKPQLNSDWALSPMVNGWAVITEEATGKMNLVNREAQLLSRFWMSKLWPMNGPQTVGYVDTGNIDDEERYALYLLTKEGEATKWLSDGGMETVVAAACGVAYMNTGELYLLEDVSAPLLTTADVRLYVDCGAMVVRSPETGKCALYVQGKQHYDFLFDDIRPVESEITWQQDDFTGEGGTISLCYVNGAEYPQPLTHYFQLTNEGAEEFVALSTLSVCPVVLH